MDCTIRIAKTKALISCAGTAQLICVFVFAYAKSRFSHNEAHFYCFCSKELLPRPSRCLRKAALFYCGTPWAFHTTIRYANARVHDFAVDVVFIANSRRRLATLDETKLEKAPRKDEFNYVFIATKSLYNDML